METGVAATCNGENKFSKKHDRQRDPDETFPLNACSCWRRTAEQRVNKMFIVQS